MLVTKEGDGIIVGNTASFLCLSNEHLNLKILA